jgi:hypothetical protein
MSKSKRTLSPKLKVQKPVSGHLNVDVLLRRWEPDFFNATENICAMVRSRLLKRSGPTCAATQSQP